MKKVLDELDLKTAALYAPSTPHTPRCILLPQFVMAYDFTASPLILQHFCHFAPLSSLHPAPLPPPPSSGTFFCIFIPISLPFVIISQLILLTVSIPSASGSWPQGVGSLALHRPLQTCNTSPSPSSPPCSPFFLSPSFSAVDERRQLEETERNGPNYSIGN